MPLRCLLFSSNEEMLQPIWQVLADLGIEAEYCRNAVDAVEKVTTQLFQIVITDWEDQPEATFLLKTARDQKAAQRPLTIAIVSDDAKLPEALQAGANSIIVRPIRPEIVRDTMTTACQLLRSKQPAPARIPAEAAEQPQVKEMDAMAAAASGAGTVSPPVSLPQDSEKTLRAGEFLHGSGPAPGAQFDTECEVQKSLDQAAASEVDALTALEPMASAVESASAEQAAPRKALDGWASLQARLTTPEPSSPEPSTPRELPGYGETPSAGSQSMPPTEDGKLPKKEFRDTAPEAALFSYLSGESNQEVEPRARRSQHLGKSLLVSTLAIACTGLVALPRTRQTLATIYRSTTHAGRNLLNPQPTQMPQTVTQHDSFGQEGDEYKFPVVANIPDATTDPSQIRVLPVIDPTAKAVKGSEAASAPTAAEENVSPNGSQGGSTGNGSTDHGQPQLTVDQVKDQAAPSAGEIAGGTVVGSPGGVPTATGGLAQSNPPVAQAAVPEQQPRPIAAPVQVSTPPRGVPGPAAKGGIPSSLRSQLASMTPEASGAKPVEAAMSSIEPVNLPESAAWDLLIQPADPIYPDAARAGGQRGSVVLQVLIGRDGSVQDAKFLQGSLVFARAAIDAVKQWRFKPYLLNGRVVSVQSLITLHFKPAA